MKNRSDQALWYQDKGFSVIPVQPNKRPFIKWEKYQAEKAGPDQILGWWNNWPEANIGIVTGFISGLMVVDVDSAAGHDVLNELLPDIRNNMHKFDVHYFNSEMGGSELKKRLSLFDDILLHQWKFKAWERSDRFADVIKSGKGTINIIDFLEIHDNFYEIGGRLAEIHKKLKGAIAIIALQKNAGCDTGLGGFRGLEKPRLYLSMAPHSLKIVKAKNWQGAENPNGKQVLFKVVKGCKFIQTKDWHTPVNK